LKRNCFDRRPDRADERRTRRVWARRPALRYHNSKIREAKEGFDCMASSLLLELQGRRESLLHRLIAHVFGFKVCVCVLPAHDVIP